MAKITQSILAAITGAVGLTEFGITVGQLPGGGNTGDVCDGVIGSFSWFRQHIALTVPDPRI